jgi:hypothetical protein
VKKEATHEDEATILLKTVDQLGLNGGVRSMISSPLVAQSGTEVHQVRRRVLGLVMTPQFSPELGGH